MLVILANFRLNKKLKDLGFLCKLKQTGKTSIIGIISNLFSSYLRASFKALPALNFGTVIAGISIVSPV
jgi:hypothetical protein